jgi:hypothetical protein
MTSLDDLRMELIQVREAIDMAEMALEKRESENLRQQLAGLKKQEAVLRARIMEWSV